MAWIDDRIWCHPKFSGLSAAAFAAYIKSVAFSSGMGTRGRLDPSQQRLVGATTRIRGELEKAHLWDLNGDGVSIEIHDWDEHNSSRDNARELARERKRRWRERHGNA